MKVLLRSPLNPHSGYGNDGIGMATALTRLGVDVYLDPAYVQAPLPPTVARLLTKRLEPPFDVLLHHADPGQLGISPQARDAADLTVAWTMWEFKTLDNCRGKSSLRKRLKHYDAVIGYDQVSTDALTPYVPGKLGTVQGGYWPDVWRPTPRDWHGKRFSFCMVGALHGRKNPFAAIEAFKQLKEEHPEFAPAELHLKTVEPGLHKAMEQWVPGLYIHYETWPEQVLRQFYASQHVLLAPSRGEGKNMPALEMLSTGGTVIATNWGGHQQWLSSQYAYPLNFELTPISGGLPDCLAAEADRDHLKALMWQAFTNRTEAKRKGELASQVIPEMCGWEPVIERLFLKLASLVPKHGQRLLQDLRASAEQSRDARMMPVRIDE